MQEWLRLVYNSGFNQARPEQAAKMLQDRPELSTSGPYLACAVGDVAAVAHAIAADPKWVNFPGGPLSMPPLIAVTFSSLVRLPEYGPGLRASCRLLLETGADPSQTWDDPNWPENPLSALYGAAGLNHDAEMTRMLLEAGANPNDGESLYHSVEVADPACTKLLLEAGAKIEGSNAMRHVLDFDHPATLRLLLDYGAVPDLLWAIKRRRSAAQIKMLLDAGADTKGAYARAMLAGMPDVAALMPPTELSEEEQFLAACARGEVPKDAAMIARLSPAQLKQLPDLAQAGAWGAVKAMVLAGWPIAVPGGDWKASALNHAVFQGNAEMAAFLLAHGASWEERHGYGNNVLGTLDYVRRNPPYPGHDWEACARVLKAAGAPVEVA